MSQEELRQAKIRALKKERAANNALVKKQLMELGEAGPAKREAPKNAIRKEVAQQPVAVPVVAGHTPPVDIAAIIAEVVALQDKRLDSFVEQITQELSPSKAAIQVPPVDIATIIAEVAALQDKRAHAFEKQQLESTEKLLKLQYESANLLAKKQNEYFSKLEQEIAGKLSSIEQAVTSRQQQIVQQPLASLPSIVQGSNREQCYCNPYNHEVSKTRDEVSDIKNTLHFMLGAQIGAFPINGRVVGPSIYGAHLIPPNMNPPHMMPQQPQSVAQSSEPQVLPQISVQIPPQPQTVAPPLPQPQQAIQSMPVQVALQDEDPMDVMLAKMAKKLDSLT